MAEIAINLKGNDNLSSTVKDAKKAVDDLKYSSTELGKCAKDFDRITNSGKSLKGQLNQLKALMADMNMKGLANTDEFQKIAQYAGQVKDAISDASEAVDKFSSDTMNIDAAVQALQGVAAAGSIATGAMALFGTENEHVTQAILKVQSALAILNGVQSIANVLNKDSALMLKLKSLMMTANTAAEKANTTATTVNTTATVANTAATETATTAQLANNAAVLANPYVLAAAAVAALTAGIIAWVSANNDATESQEAVNMAIDAFNEASESQMGKVSEQITTFNRLKKIYDENATKTDVLTKKIIENKDAQRTLGVTLKTVDDVHRLFGKNSQNYINAAIARANAMAAEAAEAALLGKALSALSKVYAKLMKGEEVDYKEFVGALEKVGISSNRAWEIMQQAGGQYERDIIFGNLKVDQDKIGDFMTNLNSIITKEFYENGSGKTLGEMFEKSMKDFEVDTKSFDDLLAENEKKEKKNTKSTKEHTKATKETKEEIKKILTSLEGCDAIIQEAEKKMKKLDSTSKTYHQDLEKIKKTILTARVAKLQLLDQNTLSGLAESKNIIQQIIRDLPKGSQALGDWQKKLNEINEKSYNIATAMVGNGGLAQLKKVQSAIDDIIQNLPEGSEELKKWVGLWDEVNDKVETIEKEISNLKAGIEKGSLEEIQQQIKKLDEQLQKKNLNISTRIEIQDKKDDLQRKIDKISHGELSIPAKVTATYIQKGSDEDLRQSFQNAQTEINRILDDLQKGVIKTRKEAQDQINIVNSKLKKLGLKPIKVHVETDFEYDFKQINEKISNGIGVISGIDGVVGSMDSLVSSLEDGANAWTVFVDSVRVVESVMSSVATVIDFVNKTIQTTGEVTDAAAVINTAASTSQMKSAIAEMAATEAAATATAEKAVTDEASIAPTTAATVALKAQEMAYMDMAAAAIFAAHAAIPFAGVGIASGLVSAMMAALAAQHAASASLAAFKEGGIVGGTPYEHPILAHKGEMILNEKQQSNLFSAIDNNRLGSGGTISFKIKGSDLYGTLHNFSAKAAKTGKITGII